MSLPKRLIRRWSFSTLLVTVVAELPLLELNKHQEEQEVLNALFLLGKGKAVPLQAWSGPERSRKKRFPDFITTA